MTLFTTPGISSKLTWPALPHDASLDPLPLRAIHSQRQPHVSKTALSQSLCPVIHYFRMQDLCYHSAYMICDISTILSDAFFTTACRVGESECFRNACIARVSVVATMSNSSTNAFLPLGCKESTASTFAVGREWKPRDVDPELRIKRQL
jgi:hypothetical protein